VRSRFAALPISFGSALTIWVLGVIDVLEAVQEQVIHALDVFAKNAHGARPF
jgi:hypothetical protein